MIGPVLFCNAELSNLLVTTVQKIYYDEKLKAFITRTSKLKEKYLQNNSSKTLEKIVKFMLPLREDKLILYYKLLKSMRTKIENEDRKAERESAQKIKQSKKSELDECM